MAGPRDVGDRGFRALLPLAVVSGAVVLVVFGLARGVWWANLHNGMLGLAFVLVGAYVLFQRPGHREGQLFLAAGGVESLMFFGRQVGRAAAPDGAGRWWAWLGVWPLAIGLALTTVAVFCFPNGRLPSPAWRMVTAVVFVLAVVCSSLSVVWPVDYDSAGISALHPLNIGSPPLATGVWSAIAHPAYIAFQLLWVVAVVARWRISGETVRRQVVWLIAAAAVSLAALVVGLLVWHSPRMGLLSTPLVPIAAGWAIVHGQHVAAYSALSWLSRTGSRPRDLPTELVKATADALLGSGAILWAGDVEHLHAIGVWPETDADVGTTTLAALEQTSNIRVAVVTSQGQTIGALSINRTRTDPLSLSETRLFNDLASQAALVIEHFGLTDLSTKQRQTGQIDGLTVRERQVLELMARGLSNGAICEQLHLSIKSVEPVVSAIFTKIGLHPDASRNRRVLAVLTFVGS